MSYQSPGQYLTYERTSPPRQLDFGIADLSVSGRTQWLYCGHGEKKLCLHLVIPSGVTGAYTLETSNDGTLASGEAHEATATSAWTSAQPAGSGAHLCGLCGGGVDSRQRWNGHSSHGCVAGSLGGRHGVLQWIRRVAGRRVHDVGRPRDWRHAGQDSHGVRRCHAD